MKRINGGIKSEIISIIVGIKRILNRETVTSKELFIWRQGDKHAQKVSDGDFSVASKEINRDSGTF